MVLDAFRHQLARVHIVHDDELASTLPARRRSQASALGRQRARSSTERRRATIRGDGRGRVCVARGAAAGRRSSRRCLRALAGATAASPHCCHQQEERPTAVTRLTACRVHPPMLRRCENHFLNKPGNRVRDKLIHGGAKVRSLHPFVHTRPAQRLTSSARAPEKRTRRT